MYRLTFILLFFTTNLLAQDNSLDYYLKLAQQNNPSLKEDSNQIKISGLEQQKIKSQYNKPQVFYTTNLMKAPIFNGYGYDVAISNGALISSQINVEQQLFTNSITKTKINEQTNILTQFKNNSLTTLHHLNLQITQLYIQCYFNQKLIENSSRIYDNYKKQQAILKSLYKNGITNLTDLKLLETELSNQYLDIKSLKFKAHQDFSVLNQLCGINDTSTIELSKPNIKKSTTYTSFYKSLFNNEFKTDSLMIENEKNNFNLKYKPQLYLFGNAGINAIAFTDIDKRFGVSGGINLTIPIYDGKQKSINNQQSQLKQAINKDYRDYKKNQISLQLDNINQQINLIDEQLEIVKKQQNDYENLLKLYNTKLNNGLIQISDYLIFMRTYLTTKTKEIDLNQQKLLSIAMYNYLNW